MTRIEAHGHRGARGLRPENTLPAFAHALSIGVDAVELDVGLTADGVPVVHHDQTLSALTARDTLYPCVGRPIRELTLAQIKTVDAGVRRALDADDPFVLTQLPMPGTPVATLAEVCALVGGSPVGLAVELKTDPTWSDAAVGEFVEAVVAVLDAHGMTARSRLLGFDWRFLPHARRHAPAAHRSALVETPTLDPAWLAGQDPAHPAAGAFAAGATVFSPQHVILTRGLYDDAASLGMPVTVWTVNEPAEMIQFMDMGVAAIVTDYPDRLREAMRLRGLPLPRRHHPRRHATAR
ncbi:MAG: glycerophosphodiester phosphodiesterase family protein [Streptosporangiaceae bacterium]